MKVTKITHTEPVLTLELTLGEMKQLRDIFGAFSPNELQDRITKVDGLKVHPNFKEFVHRTYQTLYSEVRRAVEASNSSER